MRKRELTVMKAFRRRPQRDMGHPWTLLEDKYRANRLWAYRWDGDDPVVLKWFPPSDRPKYDIGHWLWMPKAFSRLVALGIWP
jgi:hypothetical protein